MTGECDGKSEPDAERRSPGVTWVEKRHQQTCHKEADPPDHIAARHIKRIAPNFQQERNHPNQAANDEADGEDVVLPYHDKKYSELSASCLRNAFLQAVHRPGPRGE